VSSRQIGLGTFKPNAKAREYIDDILDSGRISYGKYSKELEDRFATLHECRYGVLSNSGTSSLQVALQAMKELYGWHDGDVVFVPASTFVATVNVVLHCNLKPVLVDVSLDDYAMDPIKLNEAIQDVISPSKVNRLGAPAGEPRCVMPVHPFGQSANMSAITSVAKEHGLKVIEDSCEAMFVNHEGRSVGGMGDVGCFSFYVAHLITAGIGGIATTSDAELAMHMRSLVNHGRDSIYLSIDDDEDFQSEVVDKRFRFTSVGHSFRITELEAALALSQLDAYSVGVMLDSRRSNAKVLTTLMNTSSVADLVSVPKVADEKEEHSFMMYPILLDESLDKSAIVHALEELGIETRDMLPITNQPVYHDVLSIKEDDYPMAKRINNYGFYVGCHQDLTEDDMEYVAQSLISVIEKQGVVNG